MGGSLEPATERRGSNEDEETETFSLRFPNLNFGNMDAEGQKLAENLGPDVILVGWSMGGMLALQVAAWAPGKVLGLVLVSTTPKFIRSEDFPYGLPPALLKRLRKRIKSEGISAFHSLIFKKEKISGLAQISMEQAEKELSELAKADLREILPEIKAPTLIIHGNQDKICLPAAAKYMEDKILNSKLVMMDGVGHAPMIEVPQLFNLHLRRFIESYVK